MNVNQEFLQLEKNINSKRNDKAFCTDVREKSEIQQQSRKLRKFVQQIDKKIDYAQWKQDLVLKYNYMPLKRITERVQNQKINYINRINKEEQLGAHILSGKEITIQLDLFRQFSKKLKQKMRQIQLQIAEQKMKNHLLSIQAEQKRERLKQKIKENILIMKESLVDQNIKNRDQINSLAKSRSTKTKLNPASLTIRTQSLRNGSERNISSQNTKRQYKIRNHNLYEECLSQLINSIQSMKSSEDIQSGIYLDIMEKNDKKNYKTEKRYAKSKIFQTLKSKYGYLQSKFFKSSENKANFDMDWLTFKQLNWKQIMGIVLVKDKNCQKTKKLLKYK